MAHDNKSALRETSHFIIETVEGRWFIVSSLSTRKDTQVINIERYTGRLVYSGQPGIDLFPSPKEALQHISHGKKVVKSVLKCCAIIGMLNIGQSVFLLVVTKVRASAFLPPRHRIYTIEGTKWLRISLGYPFVQSKNEVKNLELLTEYPIDGLHFYCETLDITRHFPSNSSLTENLEKEFSWNEHLASPFARIGMREWCCILMQGLAISKNLPCPDASNGVNVVLITRKSSKNPGTRYFARGLDAVESSPGNEYECELIVWKENQSIVNWASHVWRRGTVPIHWKSEINSAVADADIIISPKPYENVDKYYKRLVDRYGNNPITIFSLLRHKLHPGESVLSEHFQESLNVVKKTMAIDLVLINFDWLNTLKQAGLDKSVEGLWNLLKKSYRDVGITHGAMNFAGGKLNESKILRRQTGVIRYNCADSLDRTNLATFFSALQVVSELCRSIGVGLCNRKGSNEEWSMLDGSLEDLKRSYDEGLLVALAEMFVLNGDVCSTLYTNSPAMHTHVIREFAPHMNAAPLNAKILVQRRLQNVLQDKHRQAQYEMFVGIDMGKYFPNQYLKDNQRLTQYITTYPAFVFKHIPSEVGLTTKEEFHFLKNGSPHCWICPRDHDYIELYVYLPYYCCVTEMAITVRHGVSYESAPNRMDVFVGTHLDDCVPGFQGLQIPRCENGTKLLYSLPPQISGIKHRASDIYDFEGNVPSNCMRVVHITFHGIPPNAFMTLGQIQLFGTVLEKKSKTHKQVQAEVEQAQIMKMAEDLITNVRKKFQALIAFGDDQQQKHDDDDDDETNDSNDNINNSNSNSNSNNQEDNDDQEEDEEVKLNRRPRRKKALTTATALPVVLIKEEDGHAQMHDEDNNENNTSDVVDNNFMRSESVHQSDKSFDSNDGMLLDFDDLPSALDTSSDPDNNNNNNEVKANDEAINNENNSDSNGNDGDAVTTSEYISSIIIADKRLSMRSSSLQQANSSHNNNEPNKLEHQRRVRRNSETVATKKLKTQQYIEAVHAKLASLASPEDMTFTDSLELEKFRLRIGLSPQLRDSVLVEYGYKVSVFDPNNYIYRRDEKVESATRKKLKSQKCHNCQTSIKLRNFSCRYCSHTFCKNCMSEKKKSIIEFMWTTPQKVCISCEHKIDRQNALLEEIIPLSELEDQKRQEEMDSPDSPDRIFTRFYPPANRTIEYTTEPICVSTFPDAGILSSVVTDTENGSLPIESILLPPLQQLPGEPAGSMWFAPVGTNSVNVIIILPCYATITSLVLITDSLGYRGYDLPEIQISLAERLPRFDNVGEWKLCPEKPDDIKAVCLKPDQRIEFVLNSKAAQFSRLVSLKVSLPSKAQLVGGSTTLEDLNNDPDIAQRRLHLGRLVVMGRPEQAPETNTLLSPNNKAAYDSVMEIPRSVEFVPRATLWSKFMRESMTLDIAIAPENYQQSQQQPQQPQSYSNLSQGAVVSGFKYEVKHGSEGVSSQVKELRVSLLGVNHKNQISSHVVVGDYLIPKVGAGTVLIFEFLGRVYDKATIARFEFLSNYGAMETAIGKVSLFVNKRVI